MRSNILKFPTLGNDLWSQAQTKIQISPLPGQQDNSNAPPPGQSDRSNPRPIPRLPPAGLTLIGALFIRCKYGHCEMRNKKLINRRNDITQGWQFCSPLISPWKRKGKKEEKVITTRGIRSRSHSLVLPAANRA